MTLEKAQKYIGKEVSYMNITGVLQRVNQINGGNMVVGATDTGLVVNMVLYKYKDEHGSWKPVE